MSTLLDAAAVVLIAVCLGFVIWAHLIVFGLMQDRLGLEWWQGLAILVVLGTWSGSRIGKGRDD